MSDSDHTRPADQPLTPGQRLYDETGREVGVIRAITEYGVEVNTHSDIDILSLRHIPGQQFGEGYLLWRCSECGELGDVEEIPDRCPNCGSSREALYAYLED